MAAQLSVRALNAIQQGIKNGYLPPLPPPGGFWPATINQLASLPNIGTKTLALIVTWLHENDITPIVTETQDKTRPVSQRNFDITVKVLQGDHTLAQIGAEYDLGRERIRQCFFKTMYRAACIAAAAGKRPQWGCTIAEYREAKGVWLERLAKVPIRSGI